MSKWLSKWKNEVFLRLPLKIFGSSFTFRLYFGLYVSEKSVQDF
jgi:hypothetical protein